MSAATPYRPIIERVATLRGLNADLVEALILHESSGNPWAWKPEPAYRYFWNVWTHAPFRALTMAEIASQDPPRDFPALAGDRHQEWQGQRASWGLMQVMGAVAREHGFGADYLPQLCDPESNILIGCSLLASLYTWAQAHRTVNVPVVRQVLGAYNAGPGNWNSPAGQHYADAVLEKVPA